MEYRTFHFRYQSFDYHQKKYVPLFGYNYEFDLELHNSNVAEWSRDLQFCMYDKLIFDLIFLRVSKYRKYSINSTIQIERC